MESLIPGEKMARKWTALLEIDGFNSIQIKIMGKLWYFISVETICGANKDSIHSSAFSCTSLSE